MRRADQWGSFHFGSLGAANGRNHFLSPSKIEEVKCGNVLFWRGLNEWLNVEVVICHIGTCRLRKRHQHFLLQQTNDEKKEIVWMALKFCFPKRVTWEYTTPKTTTVASSYDFPTIYPTLFIPFRNWNHVKIKFSEHPNILMELIQFFMEVRISRSPNFFRVSSIF